MATPLSVTAQYANGQKVIYASADGTFRCVCSAKPNGHSYTLSKTLLWHAPQVKALDLENSKFLFLFWGVDKQWINILGEEQVFLNNGKYSSRLIFKLFSNDMSCSDEPVMPNQGPLNDSKHPSHSNMVVSDEPVIPNLGDF